MFIDLFKQIPDFEDKNRENIKKRNEKKIILLLLYESYNLKNI